MSQLSVFFFYSVCCVQHVCTYPSNFFVKLFASNILVLVQLAKLYLLFRTYVAIKSVLYNEVTFP